MGTDGNTAALAVESIRRWWQLTGKDTYPDAAALPWTPSHYYVWVTMIEKPTRIKISRHFERKLTTRHAARPSWLLANGILQL